MEQTKRLYRIVDMVSDPPRVWTQLDDEDSRIEHDMASCGYRPYPGCPGGWIRLNYYVEYLCPCSCHKKAR